jgi:hypothetical protein
MRKARRLQFVVAFDATSRIRSFAAAGATSFEQEIVALRQAL